MAPVQQRNFFLPWHGLPNTLEAKQLARSTRSRWISSSSHNNVQMNLSGTKVLDMVFVSCLPRFFPTLHKIREKGFSCPPATFCKLPLQPRGCWIKVLPRCFLTLLLLSLLEMFLNIVPSVNGWQIVWAVIKLGRHRWHHLL